MCLASCIDGREEVHLEADGSGKARFEFSMPASAARLYGGDTGIRTLISDITRSNPDLTLHRNEVSSESGRTHITVDLSFRSATSLVQAESIEPPPTKLPAAATHLLGEIQAIVDGRTVNLTRSMSPARAIPGATLMPASQFSGHRLQTIVHLPSPARHSNATRTENQGRTLIWDYSLADAIQSPIEQQLEVAFPLPIKTILGGTLAVALAGFLTVRTFSRRTKPSNPTENSR